MIRLNCVNILRRLCTSTISIKNNPNILPKSLRNRIKVTGPITLAEYMKEVLTNAHSGYYMNKDVFGEKGDFITSPEINQIFGEMIGIWLLNEWLKLNAPKPFQIVELGPGRGTLSQDILRVFKQFDKLNDCSLSLVEVSPFLSLKQAERLCSKHENVTDSNSVYYKSGKSKEGVDVKWFKQFCDIPPKFSLIVAHELFDALPIHKFVKTPDGYREILIDIDEGNSFRYVMARNSTPASAAFLSKDESREHVEFCPQGLMLAEGIAEHLKSYGGVALIADYGHSGESKDTFRAFKHHKLHNPLVDPGTADLTADVDFKALIEAATRDGKSLAVGPVKQREFLLNLGFQQRLSALEKRASPEQKQALSWGSNILLDENEMGARFKMVALFPSILKKYIRNLAAFLSPLVAASRC